VKVINNNSFIQHKINNLNFFKSTKTHHSILLMERNKITSLLKDSIKRKYMKDSKKYKKEINNANTINNNNTTNKIFNISK